MNRRTANKLAKLQQIETERALRSIEAPGHPRPFYLSFLVRDEEEWEIAASFGSLYADSHWHRRYGYCDVRVGSYRQDQVRDGGLNDNSTDDDSYKSVELPIGGGGRGLQHSLWRLAEVRYREAVEALATKKAFGLTYLDRTRRWPSFQRLDPITADCFEPLPAVDAAHWRAFVKRASAILCRHPQIKDSRVTFKALNQLGSSSAPRGACRSRPGPTGRSTATCGCSPSAAILTAEVHPTW